MAEISAETKALIERARQKRLQPPEYMVETFAISNLGMLDVDQFIALLMPSRAASIAVGAVRDVPVVTKGSVTVERRMKGTLDCNHRALDHPQELVDSVVAR